MSTSIGASKFMAAAAIAIAAMTGAPTGRQAAMPSSPYAQMMRRGRGRRRRGGWNSKNETARNAGIPKAFRQYAKRYGSDVMTMIALQHQIPAAMLDHGRDRREKFLRICGAHK